MAAMIHTTIISIAPTLPTLLSTSRIAAFARAASNTSGGISRTASQIPPGVMIKSSRYPRMGIKSGMRSIGLNVCATTKKIRLLHTTAYAGHAPQGKLHMLLFSARVRGPSIGSACRFPAVIHRKQKVRSVTHDIDCGEWHPRRSKQPTISLTLDVFFPVGCKRYRS